MPNKKRAELAVKGYGENFKAIRESKGMTLVEIGELVGYSDKTISLIETEKRQPTAEQLDIYREKFGVSLDYLTGHTKVKEVELSKICDYVGLSEEAVSVLHSLSENKNRKLDSIINDIITSEYLIELARDLYFLQTLSEKIVKDNCSTKEGFEEDERKYIKLLRYEISEKYTALLDKYDYRKQNPKEYQEAINRNNVK